MLTTGFGGNESNLALIGKEDDVMKRTSQASTSASHPSDAVLVHAHRKKQSTRSHSQGASDARLKPGARPLRSRRRLKRGKKKWRRAMRPRKPVPLQPVIAPDIVEAERSIAYEDGFRKGKYEGGEAVLAGLIPEDHILPDIPVEHVIALGFEQVKHLLKPLVDPQTILAEMIQALDEQRPMSLVRLGDGELLALAHDRVLSSALVQREGPFLPYSGIEVPDHEYREQLAESVRKATFVGIPTAKTPNFQGLVHPLLRSYGMSVAAMRLTYSTVNYMLAQQGALLRLMQGRRVLVIGNVAEELSQVLQQHGIAVAGLITPVIGVRDIARVMQEARSYQYDFALVAAGIPAVILAERIASQYGKVAIDFGHLANKIASREHPL